MNSGTFDEKRNLIVNYLPQTFTQDDVKEMFERIGPVSNCKLIRNFATGNSLGYAFIEYPTIPLAEDAIKQLDGVSVQNKRLKVSYARKSSGEIKNSNVYVSGLPQWVDENSLHSLFSPFGEIITHKLLLDANKKSRGVGFIRYSLKADAEKAIEEMGGKVLENSTSSIVVKLAIPPANKQAQTAAVGQSFGGIIPGVVTPHQALLAQALPSVSSPFGNSAVVNPATMINSVYVFGLQPQHTELTLYELFSPFGGILNVKLIRDVNKPEKPCKGYGFINFRKQDEALLAIKALNSFPFEGKVLQVSFKQNKGIVAQQPQHSALTTMGMIGSAPQPQQNLLNMTSQQNLQGIAALQQAQGRNALGIQVLPNGYMTGLLP